LSPDIRAQVWQRNAGACRLCGQPGAEIDHIRDDSPDLDNLQLLCADCHHAKTAERMVPASAEQWAMIAVLYERRVQPKVPARLCDDEQQWPKQWQTLKKARRQRLLVRIEG
jgi:hypothetical protein